MNEYVITVNGKEMPYGDFVNALAKPMGDTTNDMLHAVVGISGEAGELLDAVKKTWVYNKPLDVENVIEEIGDLYFYISHLKNVLNISDKTIMDHNVAKLSKRYGTSYSDKAAQERADKQ